MCAQRLPQIAASCRRALHIKPISDQSIFVRAAISGVVREAHDRGLPDRASMILIFLGSWRRTLIIAVSIPLSVSVVICWPRWARRSTS